MRKLVLFGVVLALASGCGRGWLPMFRGAPCNGSGCCAPAMPASYGNGCATCGNSAGYGDYQGDNSGGETAGGEIYGGESNYYNGGTVIGDYPIQGTTASPPMAPLTTPAN